MTTTQQTGEDRKRLLLGGSCVLVIVASLLWIIVAQFKPSATVRMPHEALGHVLAEKTAQLLNDRGQIVVLTMDARKEPSIQFEVNAFVKVLDSHPGVICMATETIKSYQLPREGLQMDFDGERFLDLLHHYPRADAVVSFVGAPKLTPKQMSELPARLPKLLVVGRRRKEVRVLFEKRLLNVLIVPRYTFPTPLDEPKTVPAWFEKYFQIVTSADQLPGNEPE